MTTKKYLRKLLKEIAEADRICLNITTIKNTVIDPLELEELVEERLAMQVPNYIKPSLN